MDQPDQAAVVVCVSAACGCVKLLMRYASSYGVDSTQKHKLSFSQIGEVTLCILLIQYIVDFIMLTDLAKQVWGFFAIRKYLGRGKSSICFR